MKCSQCDRAAMFNYGGVGLCVDHYYKILQADYIRVSMLATHLNFIRGEIEAGVGGIVRLPKLVMPPLPSAGDSWTFNNINVDRSTIGAINTGIVSNLDAGISLMQSQGQDDLAAAIKELAQTIVDTKEISDSLKNEINEQLQFLVAQATTEPKNRSTALSKSVLTGVRDLIMMAPAIIAIWDKVEPLIKAALSMG